MNKKGFTLIELLAVVAVIIIVSLIVIPTVTKSIKNAEKKLFIATVTKILEKAEEYANEGLNSFVYPIDGETKYISINDLVTSKKIKQTSIEGYVAVFASGIGEYKFFAYLSSDKYSVDGTLMSNISTNIINQKAKIDYTNFLNEIKYPVYSINDEKLLSSNYYTIDGTNDDDSFTSSVEVDNGIIGVGSFGSLDGTFSGLNKGGDDVFITRFDNNNQVVWSKTLGGSDTDYAFKIVKVSDGVVVLISSYSSDYDFTGISRGGKDLYAIKYDFNGNLKWIKNIGGTDSEYFAEMVKVGDNVIITATSTSSDYFFAGYIPSGGSAQYFINLNSDGTEKYVKILTGTESEALNMSVTENYIYSEGYFYMDAPTGDFSGVTWVGIEELHYYTKLNINTGALISIKQIVENNFPYGMEKENVFFTDDYIYITGIADKYDVDNFHPVASYNDYMDLVRLVSEDYFVILKYDHNFNLITKKVITNNYSNVQISFNSFMCGNKICSAVVANHKTFLYQISQDLNEVLITELPFSKYGISSIESAYYSDNAMYFITNHYQSDSFIPVVPIESSLNALLKYK